MTIILKHWHIKEYQNKEKHEALEIEVIAFETEDVITLAVRRKHHVSASDKSKWR